MSILEFLGLSGRADPASAASEGRAPDAADAVRRIVGELEAIPEDRARYLAGFAYILGRAAHADAHISDEETRKMEEIVQVLGHVPEAQAVLVVEIAKNQVRLFGGTEAFLVTRQFREVSDKVQRMELLECVFAVSAADESITVAEEGQARQISRELGLTHREFVAARAAFAEHIEALKSFRQRR